MDNTIWLIDDDESIRESMAFLLSGMGWPVRTFESVDAFTAAHARDTELVGCMLLDMRMPGMTGLEVQEELENRGVTHLSIIFLTAHGEVDAAVHAMRHGAADFIQKPAEPHKMLERVAAAVTASVELDVREHEVNRLKSLVGKLSPRENDVARCIARGLRNKEIARELGIEETTVKMHRQNALIKLDARSSAELVRIFTILDYETGDDPGSEAAL